MIKVDCNIDRIKYEAFLESWVEIHLPFEHPLQTHSYGYNRMDFTKGYLCARTAKCSDLIQLRICGKTSQSMSVSKFTYVIDWDEVFLHEEWVHNPGSKCNSKCVILFMLIKKTNNSIHFMLNF